jgi:hypothetical protein
METRGGEVYKRKVRSKKVRIGVGKGEKCEAGGGAVRRERGVHDAPVAAARSPVTGVQELWMSHLTASGRKAGALG